MTADPGTKVKPVNWQAWAIGKRTRIGTFHVRCIVWGLTMAHAERCDDEEIRAAVITVERWWKPRHPKPQKALPDEHARTAVDNFRSGPD
jgi:hypothetical protein